MTSEEYDVKRVLYVPFDQLNRDHGVMAQANTQTDVILFVESQRMLDSKPWHFQRLFFILSAARHFAQSLREEGFQVKYVKAATTAEGITEIFQEFPKAHIVASEPSSFRLTQSLSRIGVEIVANDFFLTSRIDFSSWASSQKNFLMENFYRKQRARLNILMEGSEPLGGVWNLDSENRLPPQKGQIFNEYLTHTYDPLDQEVIEELHTNYPKLWGSAPDGTWGTTRAQALNQLEHFASNNFAEFGPFEDAMPHENWAVHHSLLSPYLNLGLLHPKEVVDRVIHEFDKGAIPLNSCEGFIRQIIGWREYVNGMYWFLGEDYREKNELKATRTLLPLFTDPERTSMNCLKSVVSDIKDRAWVHHIPRLMVLSNLALLTNTNPQEFLDWMRESFIDAAEWVMVPNVIGMGMHADGGQMMTKPYISGGAYIKRMSNYCGDCRYKPALRTGEEACPFTSLYWNFLDTHREDFQGNHRMAQQFAGLKRLNDLEQVRERAEQVIEGLALGII